MRIWESYGGIGSIISILAAPSKYNSLSLLNPSKVKLIQWPYYCYIFFKEGFYLDCVYMLWYEY